jgi:hypothetical protein
MISYNCAPNAQASRLLALIAALLVPTASFAQTTPPAVYSVGAAYDTDRGRFVVFGGYFRGYIGDTWEWDGRAWTLATSTGPIARNSPALAYDEARHQMVMFGGDTRETGPLGDTWVYDGARWRQVATSGPQPRTTHQMVYDSRRQRIVLFGGGAGSQVFGDTWEWDGRQWTQRSTNGPPARTLHGLAYDRERGRTVVFGGTAVLAPNAPSFGDTWEWDGERWTEVKITGPSARDHIAMGYDAARKASIVQGGGLGDVDPNETWAFDGRAWTRVTGAGPRRRYAKLTFDTKANAMLLYGGFDQQPSNILWRLKGSTWEQLSP